MAGGKQTPRQKMINLMYLVLMALLAMNISKEVLDAFQVLSTKLNASAILTSEGNKESVVAMNAAIDDEIKNENKLENKGLIDTFKIVNGKTAEMIAIIDRHIDSMKSIGAYDAELDKYVKIDELHGNEAYWMGKGDAKVANEGRGSGHAMILHEDYGKYVKTIGDFYKIHVDNFDKKVYTGDNWAKEKLTRYFDDKPYTLLDHTDANPKYNETWERHIFKGPVVANIAQLEALKIDVYKAEKELLEKYGERLGKAKFKVDNFIPIIAPEATIVPAGLQFRAKLYLTAASSAIKPKFGGAGVKTDKSGDFGEITLNASGANIPKGKNEGTQNYSARITMKSTTGKDEIFDVKGDFKVRKPEIVVTSASVQILYRECANDVNIDVPALGDQYNPKVTATGGQVKPNPKKKRLFRLIPSGSKCVVTVNSLTNGQTVKIGDVKYKVIAPPKPVINMLVNNRPYNGASPIPKSSNVKIYVKPDKEFLSALPSDAKYGIKGIEVLAQLTLGPPKTVSRLSGGRAEKGIKITFPQQIRQARPGTKVYVRLNEIYRQNFQGKKIIDKRFPETERMLSLVVK